MPTPKSAAAAEPDDELDDNPPEPVVEEEGDEADAPPQEDDAEIEKRARRAGWRPESEWDEERAAKEGKVKPRRWMTPKEWLDRMDGNNVVLRERNRYLDSELATTKETASKAAAEAATSAARVADLSKLVDDLLKTQKQMGARAYAKAKAELESRADAAVEESNPEAYKAAKEGLKKLDEERAEDPEVPEAKPPKTPAAPVDPYVEVWAKANPWYETDATARATAVAIHGRLMKDEPELTLRENLAKVREEIADRFPELFENQRRREPPRTSAPSGDRRNGRKETTFADLTQEQKDTYERQARHFKAKGVAYTQKEFLEDQLLG